MEQVGMLLNEASDPLGFDVNPGAFKGAHFATWPPKLVEPMIRASTSEAGVCPTCGSPWRRRVEREGAGKPDAFCPKSIGHAGRGSKSSGLHEPGWRNKRMASANSLGWAQACPCSPHEPQPATVLDPFIGSGTTIVVAEALGRNGVGCDLSMDYLRMASRRISRPHARITTERPGEPLPLFD